MTLHRYSKPLLLVVACSVWVGPRVAQGQDTKTLRERISIRPFDTTVLGDVERSRDPQLLPDLRQAFEDTKAKREKQAIARTLVRLGDKDIRYFEYLASFAKPAVESGAPMIFVYGSDGKAVRGVVNPEFQAWCRDHGLDPEQELVNQFKTYPQDLM